MFYHLITESFSYTGTVLVQPEPADNGRDGFRGPEFCSRKPGGLSRRRGGQSLLRFINEHSHFSKSVWLLHVLSSRGRSGCFHHFSQTVNQNYRPCVNANVFSLQELNTWKLSVALHAADKLTTSREILSFDILS